MVNRVHMSNIIGAFVHITRDFAITARPVSADTTSISTYGFNLVDIRWGKNKEHLPLRPSNRSRGI